MSNPIMDDDDDEEESEGWLVSYADLMTLIACFFILMMAFANYDPPGFQKKAEVIAEHFKTKHEGMKETGEKENRENVLKKLKELQKDITTTKEIKKMVSVNIVNKELVINFNGNILFASGEYKIKNIHLALVDSLVSLIKDKDPNFRVIIEGHTDDLPVGDGFFTSNWSLSGARAASVAERFEMYGFAPKSLKVIAYGSSKPLKPNRDKKGRLVPKNLRLNRRVVVKILEPATEKQSLKLGLGVYFDENAREVEDETPVE